MGLEEKLPSGVLLTSVEKLVNWTRKSLAVAGDVRPGLLRHRDDGDRRRPLRPGPVRHGGLPRLAAAGRPDDRRRPGEPEDGAGPAADLRPDARAALGARHGRLRQLGRHVQQLRDRPGRRPHRPRGHVPARLPAAAGDAHRRHPQAAPQDHERAARAKRAREFKRERVDGTAKDLLVEMPSTVRVDKVARRAYEAAAAEGRPASSPSSSAAATRCCCRRSARAGAWR